MEKSSVLLLTMSKILTLSPATSFTFGRFREERSRFVFSRESTISTFPAHPIPSSTRLKSLVLELSRRISSMLPTARRVGLVDTSGEAASARRTRAGQGAGATRRRKPRVLVWLEPIHPDGVFEASIPTRSEPFRYRFFAEWGPPPDQGEPFEQVHLVRGVGVRHPVIHDDQEPEQIFLPRPNVSTTYIFATGNTFFAYPNNYNYYVNYYKDTFQHGGISMEEMMVPFVVLEPKS